MHDRLHVGTATIDLAVDEALQKHASSLTVAGLAIEAELHDVTRPDQGRGERSGHEEAIRSGRVAHGHVPEGIQDGLRGKDAARGGKVVEEGLLNRTGRAWCRRTGPDIRRSRERSLTSHPSVVTGASREHEVSFALRVDRPGPLSMIRPIRWLDGVLYA